MISFYSRRTRNRRVVAILRAKRRGVNRVRIVNLGRKGSRRARGTRVEIDALGVQAPVTRGRPSACSRPSWPSAPSPALAAVQDEEPANFAKTNERYELQTADPAFQALLVEKSLESKAEEAEIAILRSRAQPVREPVLPARRRVRGRRALL